MCKEPKSHCSKMKPPPGAPYRELNIHKGSKYLNASNKANIDWRLMKFFVIAPEYVRSPNPIAQK